MMGPFAISDLSRILANIYDNACHHAIDQFQYWILQYLQNYVKFDSATWSIHNFEDKSPRSYILFNLSDEFVSCFENVKTNDGFIYALAMSPGRVLNSFDYELMTNMSGYLELYDKFNISHMLGMLLPDEKMRAHHSIGIIRSDRDYHFSEQERQLVQAIVPHLIQAWRINCQFFLNTLEAHKVLFNQPSKMALVDYQGGVQQAIEGFDSLIKQEWEDWHGNILPVSLVEQLIKNKEETYTGNHVVITATHFEYFVALQVRERCPIDSLTPREREVAILCAQGKNHREIATELNVSPSTVRNHLQKIYSSLNINNKVQLAKLIFD